MIEFNINNHAKMHWKNKFTVRRGKIGQIEQSESLHIFVPHAVSMTQDQPMQLFYIDQNCCGFDIGVPSETCLLSYEQSYALPHLTLPDPFCSSL